MKNKQTYLTRGVFALLLFVILGYAVKFYPDQLAGIDSPIQTWLRGDLPPLMTNVFTIITSAINPPIIIAWVEDRGGFFSRKSTFAWNFN